MINYFAGSVCKPNEDYCEENFKRIINQKGFVLHGDTQQKGTYSDLKNNDIIILKYNNQFIAYGEVREIKKTNATDWNHWAYVNEWHFNDNSNKKKGVSTYGIGKHGNTIGGGQMGTVKTLKAEYAVEKIRQINENTELYKRLKAMTSKNENLKGLNENIKILKYKKQIILQGPPGTGKTRLAKQLAKEITKANKIGSPDQLINNFFENFKVKDDRRDERQRVERIRQEFLEKFPKDSLKDLSLENYVLGTEEKDGFCYWLEYKLHDTGKYTGQADKFKIYWREEEDKYIKSGFVKELADEEAMKEVANLIDNIVNHTDFSGNYPIGKGFVLKVLNTYLPETYFPINSEDCLNSALKLMGAETKNLNYITKSKKLQELFEAKRNELNSEATNWEFMRFLFNNFDLKGGIKFQDEEILTKGEYKIVQFHPSYSYEDFVRGVSIQTNKKDQIYYSVEDRILIEMANEALDNPTGNYVLIIDEINRANLSTVLGELIYSLEYRYNPNLPEDNSVESLYDKGANKEIADRTLKLPINLYIIGTMNTADRSVGHIDYAIRRRFAFIDVLPKDLSDDESVVFASSLYRSTENIFEKYTTSEFEKKDIQLGHSYFIDKSLDGGSMEIRLQYEIKPILLEYVRDGILKEEAKEKIKELSIE